MNPNWKLKSNAFQTVEEMVLAYTGATKEELINPQRVDPAQIQNLPQAAEMILQGIRSQKPIVIVGDYDADGVTASAVLTMLFQYLGSTPRVIIPKRFTDGYGISETLIADIHNSIIVCVDNGIVAVDPIQRAKEQGNQVLLLDHHFPTSVLPPADIIVDPHVEPEKNAFTSYCGAGLALKLAEQMLPLREHRPLFYNLTVLACLGTIADVMPLLGDNRRIVKNGLQIINSTRGFATLTAGLQYLLCDNLPCNEETIGFQIAPMINAVGRMYNAGSQSALKTLLCTDPAQAVVYTQKLKDINEQRKQAVATYQRKFEAMVNPDDKLLILYQPKVPEGIIGIIAGKLAEAYHVPTLVFTDAHEPDTYKGSGRSNGVFDLSLLIEYLRPLTLKAGAHAGAAGLSIRSDRFDKLKRQATEFMTPFEFGDDWKYTFYDMELTDETITTAYQQLKEYAPFGEGIPLPCFVLRDFSPVRQYGELYRLMGQQGQHLKLHGTHFDAVGFYMAEQYQALGTPPVVSLLGTLSENTFRGQTTIQFNIAQMSE